MNRARVACVLACLANAGAQDTARLAGVAVDAQGAAIPGAPVRLFPAGADRASAVGVTGAAGGFLLPGLRPGLYELEISAAGFQTKRIRGLTLETGKELALPPLRLEVGGVTGAVEVVAASAYVATSSTEVAATITAAQLQSLPVRDRGPLSILTTQAGVSSSRGPVTINGLRVSFANVTLDGINIQDNAVRVNTLEFTPNRLLLGAVAEMTVVSSHGGAASGAGAAQVSFSTPSGSNEPHGGLLWYNRNSAASANTWFNNRDGIARPRLNLNQAGGFAGGRLVRDRLFYYGYYEAYRLRQQTAVNRTIPTASARQGDFIYRNAAGGVQSVNLLRAKGLDIDPFVRDILQRVPGPERINNFRAGDSSDQLLRNLAGYSFVARNNSIRDNVLGKLDYVHSERHFLSAMYSWNADRLDRTDGANFNGFSVVPKVRNDNRANLLSASWRFNPSPAWTNELRGGFNFTPVHFVTAEPFGDTIVTGFAWSNPVNTALDDRRDTGTFQFQDNATWTRAGHNVSFGFQSQSVDSRFAVDNGVRPTWTIGFATGSPFALTLADLPGVSAQDLAVANRLLASLGGFVATGTRFFNTADPLQGFSPGALREQRFVYHNLSGYVQDQFKLGRRLTLTAGLRYEYWTRLEERNGRALLPVVENGRSVIDTLLGNATLALAGGVHGRPWYNADRNNFAPSFGFAADPWGGGRTSIRGGYAVNFVNDQLIQALDFNVTQNNRGLQQQVALRNQTARAGAPLPEIPLPAYRVPRQFSDNWALDRASAAGMPDPNLRTPYVQQFSLGIQHRIWNGVMEARYAGNRQTKLFRAFDFNQIDVRENGFLDDYLRAQSNARLAQAAGRGFDPRFNAAVPGSQALSVFPRLGGGGFLTDPQVLPLILNGAVADLAQLYVDAGQQRDVRFYRNPNLLGANLMTNYSNATYHSLQLDYRRRLRGGFFTQVNYSWSKVLSDSSGDTQIRFEPFLDFGNAALERARAVFDLRHAFKANFSLPLPLGRGRLRGGWGLSGDMNWQSGNPLSILSARATLNRFSRSLNNGANTNLDFPGINSLLGVRMTPSGPFYISAQALNTDGRAVAGDGRPAFAGQVFSHPPAGTLGGLQRRMFSGPSVYGLNAALRKETVLRERHRVEVRAEAFNVLNHPTWYLEDQNIDSPNFMRINANATGRRLLQFGIYYRF